MKKRQYTKINQKDVKNREYVVEWWSVEWSQTLEFDLTAPDPIEELTEIAYDQTVRYLQEKLLERSLEIVLKKLSSHQIIVLQLFLNKHSYMEIAQKLGINYTAVSHSLMGIKKGNKYIGGTFNKIKKIVNADKTCQDILVEIAYLRNFNITEERILFELLEKYKDEI